MCNQSKLTARRPEMKHSSSRDAGSMALRRSVSFPRGTTVTYCNKVRRKEGSGQGWLVKTQVFLLTQINSHRCALRITWPHQLSQCLSDHSLYSFRLSLSYSSCARVFTPCLSMNSCSTVAFIWSPRQLLQSDTGVPHFALDPLTYRCLLSPSPAADFAEPRPPRHTYVTWNAQLQQENRRARSGLQM